MSCRIAVIYYSSTGSVHDLARAVADGAAESGAEVRLRRVAELAPPDAVAQNPDWQRHLEEEASDVPEVDLDDLDWADGIALGSPTRFGLPAAQLKQFVDTAGGLWQAGTLAGKAATAFTSAQNAHGGQESTILSLFNVFAHWGCVIAPSGYTDGAVFAAGGNPYGTSHTAGGDNERPTEAQLGAARHQGRRLAAIAEAVAPLRVGAETTTADPMDPAVRVALAGIAAPQGAMGATADVRRAG